MKNKKDNLSQIYVIKDLVDEESERKDYSKSFSEWISLHSQQTSLLLNILRASTRMSATDAGLKSESIFFIYWIVTWLFMFI